MRRLFIDIETSPNVVLSWRVGYKIKIDADNILKERAIICGCWKWQHEKQAKGVFWNNGDDSLVVERLIKEMSEADEVVAQNGDSFDAPWIRTRLMFNGVKSIPQIKTVDTLQWMRKHFYFNSNRLDYVAGYLGIGRKHETEFGLWKEIVLNNCPKAMKRMVEYCKHDVILLQKVWEKLHLYVPVKTHNAVLLNGEKWQCPRCASDDVFLNGTRVTAGGTRARRMQCNKCGGYYQIGEAAHKAYVEAKKEK